MKNLNPVVFKLYKCEYVFAINSLVILVDPYIDIGLLTESWTENGCLLLFP